MGNMKLCGATMSVKIGNSSATQFKRKNMKCKFGYVIIKKDHKYKTALKGEKFFVLKGDMCFYIDTPGMTFTLADMKEELDIFDLSNIICGL
jgi:hypothetical protein